MNKKITIYTLADRRPEFISLQYETFKKYLKDEYEFVVINNAISSPFRRKRITELCKSLNIQCLPVKRTKKYSTIGKQQVFSFLGFYTNPNVACAYPIKYFWEKMCVDNSDSVFVIIDSDMFLCNEISFTDQITNNELACILQYRGLSKNKDHATVSYIWNGICVFDGKDKRLQNINWDCGVIKKSFIEHYAVDVGGYSHFWIKENNPQIKHISEYAIREFVIGENNTVFISASLNGCYNYTFEYERTTKDYKNVTVEGLSPSEAEYVLPHFEHDFKKTLIQKTIQYFEYFILEKNPPIPTFLGLIEFETYTEQVNPFIIHMKAGSGYMGFGNHYTAIKFNFIQSLLGVDVKGGKKYYALLDILDTDVKVITRTLITIFKHIIK